MTSDGNYCGIAMLPEVFKVLYYILLDRCQGVMGSRDQQYSFKDCMVVPTVSWFLKVVCITISILEIRQCILLHWICPKHATDWHIIDCFREYARTFFVC